MYRRSKMNDDKNQEIAQKDPTIVFVSVLLVKFMLMGI